MNNLSQHTKLMIAAGALALTAIVTALIVLVVVDVISDNVGLAIFAIFAILGGVGFIADAFKGTDNIPGFANVTMRLTSMGFNMGLIVGDWGEWWWQGILVGLLAGLVIASIERQIRKNGGPIRLFRIIFWSLAGVAAIGEGVSVLARL